MFVLLQGCYSLLITELCYSVMSICCLLVFLLRRQEVLKGLHATRQGVVLLSNRAQQVVFWPGIFKELETVRDKFMDCCVWAPSQLAMPPVSSVRC